MRSIHAALGRLTGQELAVELWDGTRLGPEDAPYRMVLRHPWSLRAMLLPPSDLTAGEAYVTGAVDIYGDVVAAMAEAAKFDGAAVGLMDRARLGRKLLQLPRPPRRPRSRRAHLRGRFHSRDRDRAAISFHYDLPPAFYTNFLDHQMVYSCAYFADEDETLERAQWRKLDLICRKLRLAPGMRLLDIGCGWGSLLIHAARHYGVSGLGVTLSTTQAEAGRARVADADLEGQVEIRLQDYRDLDRRFDAVASIGMVEHVGPDHLPGYVSQVSRLIEPEGLFLNHGIVVGDPERVRTGRESTFVSAYVFPDGGLVPAWRAVREIERGGFEVLDVQQLRPHYARTLRAWIGRLERNRDAAVAASTEIDYRIWRAYMAGSAFSFESGSLGVVQILATRSGRVPAGRHWMLPGEPPD